MNELSVTTLNLNGSFPRWSRRRELIVYQILDDPPDLIALQEINGLAGQGRWLRNQLNARLGMETDRPYYYIGQHSRLPFALPRNTVGILTRLPIVAQDTLNLGRDAAALRINLELPSGTSLDFVSVQLDHDPVAQSTRLDQVMNLIGWLEQLPSTRHRILAGSWYSTPDQPPIKRMKIHHYRSAHELAYGYETLATYPTALRETGTGFCLDYIFLSSHLTDVIRTRPHCHLPAVDDPQQFASNHISLRADIVVSN